jgi:CheY-like chemotaxis protein
MMNLVINASEALGGNPGTITITTGTQHASREYLTAPHLPRDLTEGMYAYIEVRDTGSGMSEETIAHIFEPFFTTKFAGRGLGLAAALGIVRSHLGALKVTSTPGVGTAFRLLLPLKCQPPSPDTKPPSEAEPRHLTASRILLVDDEAGVRKVAQKMLASLHCTVVEAVDGEEGLARFQATPDAFDVVLLDFTMPRLQGRQVAAAIWSRRPTTPVVFMSGYNEEEDSGAATAGPEAGTRGPSVFLHKPFSVAELKAKLHAARARRGADAAARP